MYEAIPFSALQQTGFSFQFEGYKHDDINLTFIVVNATPGTGPKLHQHPYKEILIVQEGEVEIIINDEKLKAHGGQVFIIPANTPHKFVNTGNNVLKQVDIHLSPKFITDWLE